ncbi:MAG: hypothetical protein IJ535_02245 [Pseudobutyrivibrio sp.]|uniref:hypothetical protein n=1 Tax=Pseudobutyrivibrio sp. TaxID=2014367 RepID=UPI0025F8BFD7|nr:hypothetical protein [Pseudobutyrivibrio sp.]MBQ8488580.1 hypothetical protein [Pseudobutyrivibrio sp.]
MTNEYFFDTDCLSAFLWINDINILSELYGGRIIFPGPVYEELSNPAIPHLKRRADILLANKSAQIQEIEFGTEEYRVYQALVYGQEGNKQIGKGEAVGIALAKIHNGVLASNNYKDIAPYIDKYGLKHIDTGMILTEALKKNLITEEDGNDIWARMLAKNRKLPSDSFTEYLHMRSTSNECKGKPYI